MRVGINARILASKNIRGWGRYTANLIRELSHLDIDLFLFSDRELEETHLKGTDFKRTRRLIKKTKPYLLWEQKTLPDLCEEFKIDVLHCPHHFGLPTRGHFKKILTLHDTIEDQFYNSKKPLSQRLRWRELHNDFLRWLTRKNSDRIITVSEFSKKDISHYYGIDTEKVDVTHGAVDPTLSSQSILDFSELEKKYSLTKPYFLYVGGFDERKNLAFLLQAFQAMPMDHPAQLVIAGAGVHQQRFTQGLKSPQVLLIDYLPEDELASFYTHAFCFVYPSLFEGFGLQAIESMSFATPALVSNVSSLPEVVNNPDLTFDPKNTEKLAQLLTRCLEDQAFYQRAVEYARKRALDFSWAVTGRKTLQIYKNLLDGT
jgi:glycosyltransferase involved in cell wall biosynthesis